jgi:AcrR family transcriptional regulator
MTTVSPQPRELTLRQRIIDVARPLFVERGYHGVSMRQIAEAVGISKAGVYYHFADKDGLFAAVLIDGIERVSEILANARRDRATPFAVQLAVFFEGLLDEADRQLASVRLANGELRHLSAEVRQTVNERYTEDFVEPLRSMLGEAMERGELRPMNPDVGTRVLLGMTYPFLLSTGHRTVSEVVADLVAMFMFGAARQDDPNSRAASPSALRKDIAKDREGSSK